MPKEQRVELSWFNRWELYEQLYWSLHRGYQNGLDELVLDLNQIEFIPVEGDLALLTAGRFWHRLTGHPIRLVNVQEEVLRYLERIDFFNYCKPWLLLDQSLPAELYSRITDSPRLLEITPIHSREETNTTDVENILKRAQQILRAWFVDNRAIGRVCTILAEIGSNIVHSSDLGFIAIQRYPSPLDFMPTNGQIT